MCERKRATAAAASARRVLLLLVRGGWLHSRDWALARLAGHQWCSLIDATALAQRTLLLTSDACAAHHVDRARSERPERLQIVLQRCSDRFPRLRVERELPLATDDQLRRFHTDVHVDLMTRLGAKIERSMTALAELQKSPPPSPTGTSKHRKLSGSVMNKAQYYAQFETIDVDDDTRMMRHTLKAAKSAAGGVCLAVDRVMRGDVGNAFCVVRPPGHHAEPQRAMGFCFFNNVGVAAFHALDAHKLDRVAIIDFDVHHGNGTQARVMTEPRLLYVSLHQSPYYPGTGASTECGEYNNLVNVPVPARTGSAAYRRVFMERVWPRVARFKPQLLLVSAGFDAHALDPLADLRLNAQDFYWLTSEIVRMAWTFCGGRVVSALEGGYHRGALADSAEQHVLALVHGSVAPDEDYQCGQQAEHP